LFGIGIDIGGYWPVLVLGAIVIGGIGIRIGIGIGTGIV